MYPVDGPDVEKHLRIKIEGPLMVGRHVPYLGMK